jgi:hypothetical protein
MIASENNLKLIVVDEKNEYRISNKEYRMSMDGIASLCLLIRIKKIEYLTSIF